jgi:hypothetical protein
MIRMALILVLIEFIYLIIVLTGELIRGLMKNGN